MPEMSLRDARDLIDLSQTELAQEAGVDHSTIHDIERGRNKRPSYETVVRIVRALQRRGLPGITAEQLFPIPDDRAPAA